MLKKTVNLLVTIVLLAVLIYVVQWAKVVYLVASWCDQYPDTFADCRE